MTSTSESGGRVHSGQNQQGQHEMTRDYPEGRQNQLWENVLGAFFFVFICHRHLRTVEQHRNSRMKDGIKKVRV